MKKLIINHFSDFERSMRYSQNFDMLHVIGPETMSVSDGYHTMDELYEHRYVLFIALCEMATMAQEQDGQMGIFPEVWRSKLHADGTNYEGYFILGLGKDKGKQISYHLPERLWVNTDFAETLDNAPEFDGHTSADVLERLKNL